MPTTVRHFLKGTNNLVELVLTQGGVPITDSQLATEVRIAFGPWLTITRNDPSKNQGGVDWSQGNGLVVLNPAQMEAQDPLITTQVPNQQMPMSVRLIDGTNTDGVYFAGADSDPRFMISMRQPL